MRNMLNVSRFSKQEIYKEILQRIPDRKLLACVKENKALRLKCKISKIPKNCPRELIIGEIIDLYPKIAKLEAFIIDTWTGMHKEKLKRISNFENKEAFINYLQKEEVNQDLLSLAIFLWLQDEEDLNFLGDEYYEKYLKERSQQNEMTKGNEVEAMEKLEKAIEEEKKDMFIEKSLFNMKLGECVTLIHEYNNKYERLEQEIENKDKEIKNLQKQLHEYSARFKENTRLVSSFEQKLSKLEGEIKKNIKSTEDVFKSSAGQIIKLCTEMSEEQKNMGNRINELFAKNNQIKEEMKEKHEDIQLKISDISINISEEIRKMIHTDPSSCLQSHIDNQGIKDEGNMTLEKREEEEIDSSAKKILAGIMEALSE